MTLDRYTARALVDANLMSLAEYVAEYVQASEKDTLAERSKPVSLRRRPFPGRRTQRTNSPVYCH